MHTQSITIQNGSSPNAIKRNASVDNYNEAKVNYPAMNQEAINKIISIQIDSCNKIYGQDRPAKRQ